MSLLLIVFVAQAVSAPVIVPPPPQRFPPAITAEPVTLTDVQVGMTVEGRTLWQGTMRVGGPQGAIFTQSLNQAGDVVSCENGARVVARRDMLTISLNRGYRNPTQPDQFQISTNWTRSTGPVSCGQFEAPTRMIGLTDTIVLTGSKVVQVKGDGGLVVSLRRLDH
jgi:hypothetical protein